MSNFSWFTKSSTRSNPLADVCIRVNKNGGGRYTVVFQFDEATAKKLTSNSEYLIFAYDEENMRVYFKEATAIDGFKVGKTNPNSPSRRMGATVINFEMWMKFIGDYSLLYDKTEKLSYIDLTKRIL